MCYGYFILFTVRMRSERISFNIKRQQLLALRKLFFYDLMHLKMKTIFSYMDLITLMSLNVLRLSASLN